MTLWAEKSLSGDDDDDKLVVVSDTLTVADDEIRSATHFQEQFFKSDIIRVY